MTWTIVIAAVAGVLAWYCFRYRVEEVLNFPEYFVLCWPALLTGVVGAGIPLLIWTHISTVLGWFGYAVEWPALDWMLAAVVGFAGRHIYKIAPQLYKYARDLAGKKLAP